MLSQNAMSINHQGRDGHTGDFFLARNNAAVDPPPQYRMGWECSFLATWLRLFTVLSSSPAQRLFPRAHPPGAVPAGQRGRHEPGGLRSEPVQRGEG